MNCHKHVNPGKSPRTSSAAYNFVELPEKVVKAVKNIEELPKHDTYTNPNYPHTGYFTVNLTAKTPFYVRCPLTPDEIKKKEKDEESLKNGEAIRFTDRQAHKPDFFYTNKLDKIKSIKIPGSSLRGMLRSILEIVSYSKVNVVSKKKLFFRSLDNSSLGTAYRERMKNIEAGFWHQDNNSYRIEKCCVASIYQYPFFRKSCIKNPNGLIERILLGEDTVSEFIKSKITNKNNLQINELINELIQTLNTIIEDTNREWIKNINTYKLSEKAKKYINLTLQTEKVIQVNRILLEEIYPEFINKNQMNQSVATLFGKDELFELYETKGKNLFPKWKCGNEKIQYRKVWISKEKAKEISDNLDEDVKQFRVRLLDSISLEQTEEYSQEAVLVLTGFMQSKKRAFVFFKKENPEIIPVINDLSEENLANLFNDQDQLTQWQQKAFPKDNCRKQNGHLCEEEPIFFLREGENKKLSFFGRARMFRLPYLFTPFDFVLPEIRDEEQIDFAEAIFGREKDKAFASRVSVTDAELITEASNDIFLSEEPIVPHILAIPKPAAFQHYLTQKNDSKNSLMHYDNEPIKEACIRGHKLYWHRGKIEAKDIKATSFDEHSTQHTQFRPLKAESSFSFKIYFENLSDEELGALCWVLAIPGEAGKIYCHKIGMGKSFGMGSVKLDFSLFLQDRKNRYTSLLNENMWQACSEPEHNWEHFLKAFECKIITEISATTGFTTLSRIKQLLKMLEWGDTLKDPNFKKTLNLEDKHNNFKERPVLPDPLYSNSVKIIPLKKCAS